MSQIASMAKVASVVSHCFNTFRRIYYIMYKIEFRYIMYVIITYLHQQKLLEIPLGLTLKSTNEVMMILEKPENMIIGEGDKVKVNTRKIFKKKPGLCWDN